MTLDFEGRGPGVLQGAQNTNHEVGFASLIGTALSVIMVFGVLLVMYFLVMAGISWITSNGDKGKLDEARTRIMQTLVGIIILASVLALVSFVQYVLGIQILTFNYAFTTNIPIIIK